MSEPLMGFSDLSSFWEIVTILSTLVAVIIFIFVIFVREIIRELARDGYKTIKHKLIKRELDSGKFLKKPLAFIPSRRNKRLIKMADSLKRDLNELAERRSSDHPGWAEDSLHLKDEDRWHDRYEMKRWREETAHKYHEELGTQAEEIWGEFIDRGFEDGRFKQYHDSNELEPDDLRKMSDELEDMIIELQNNE
jgi:predicted transcriptional regulator